MPKKTLSIRRADRCADCGTELPAGTRAEWDPGDRTVTCLPCADSVTRSGSPDADATPPVPTPPPYRPKDQRSDEPAGSAVNGPEDDRPSPVPSLDTGVPGASARAEHDRRRVRREEQLEQRWGTGRLGRLAKALSDDPQSTKAWAQGAAGEEQVARVLHRRLGESAVLLHDRKVPGTRGNIDHIVIASSGVWIVDAKRYQGKVERRDVGGLLRSDVRLYVGGRDRSKLVAGMQWQFDAVLGALGGLELPVHRALSFVDADWPLFFAKPLRFGDVWVSWPSKMAELIAEPGPLDDEVVERAARLLAGRLPAA